MTKIPSKPTGRGSMFDFARNILKCVRERTIIAGFGIKIDRTAEGTVIKVDESKIGKGSGSIIPRWQ